MAFAGLAMVISLSITASWGQSVAAGPGSIVWKGLNIKGRGGRPALTRKRFYLYAGGLAENKALVEALRSVEIPSRECFYTEANASPCFVKWLEEENCESPFCRKITEADIAKVPEYKSAYDKGLTLYGARSDLAVDWLLDSLSPSLLSGYALKRRSVHDALAARFPYIQQVMTTAKAAEGRFVGLAAGTYTVTNLVPIEINGGSYLWLYEVKVSATNPNVSVRPTLEEKRAAGSILVRKDLKHCAVECPAK